VNTLLGRTDLLDFQHLFDALSYPAFVLTAGGKIEHANQFSRHILGEDPQGKSLIEFEMKNPEALEVFIKRCAGSTNPLVGKFHIRGQDGKVHGHRCNGRLLRPKTGQSQPALLFIDCEQDKDRFSILTQQVRDLNAEIGRRKHAQAVLEESLRQQKLLMRELHHRVRNNLQMLNGMLTIAGFEIEAPEAQEVLTKAAQRVLAIAAVQQVFYKMEISERISGDDVIKELCNTLTQGSLYNQSIELTLEPLQWPNDIAVPLVLILNELLINAAKYSSGGQIKVDLRQTNGEMILSVQDQGPGFTLLDTKKKTSGLGLVKGMARQLGAKFEVKNNGGAVCVVRLKERPPKSPSP
jgi:two-component sensor histidine kinase